MFRQNSSRQNFVENLIVVLWLEFCFQVSLVLFEFSVFYLERSNYCYSYYMCIYIGHEIIRILFYMTICLIILELKTFLIDFIHRVIFLSIE